MNADHQNFSFLPLYYSCRFYAACTNWKTTHINDSFRVEFQGITSHPRYFGCSHCESETVPISTRVRTVGSTSASPCLRFSIVAQTLFLCCSGHIGSQLEDRHRPPQKSDRWQTVHGGPGCLFRSSPGVDLAILLRDTSFIPSMIGQPHPLRRNL